MDSTPKTENTTFVSSRIFESTPKASSDSTLVHNINLKKRKVQYQYCDKNGRKLDSLLNSSSPQASSTFNESLNEHFENIQIESKQNFFSIEDCDEPSSKFLKSNSCAKIVTPPSTPESHMRSFNSTPRKTGSFQKCPPSCSVSTPLKEQHDILYPTLKPLEPQRKFTPQKLREKIAQTLDSKSTLAPECRLNQVLGNHVIMDKIFENLSNGDLYRFAQVSKACREALFCDFKASVRCSIFKDYHKKNKENYKITPPSSPESQYLFQDGSISPNSKNFASYVETGSILKPNQSLTKCPKCKKPSIVENAIAQCQHMSCGYIFCQKCDSCAYNPEDFYDNCQGLVLESGTGPKLRLGLDDLTNCSLDFNVSSILNSTATDNNYYSSSGYFSGYESSHTPLSVKRNLSSSFNVNESLTRKQQKTPYKPLFDANRSYYVKAEVKRKSSNNFPVVKSDIVRKKIETIEPSSPPKVKQYTACSKESRRSLKRLTR